MKKFIKKVLDFWLDPAGIAAVCRSVSGFILAGSLFFSNGIRFLQNAALAAPLFLLLLLFFCKNKISRIFLIIFTAIILIIVWNFSWQLPVLTVALWVFFTAAGAVYCAWIFRGTARWVEIMAAVLTGILGIGLVIKAFRTPVGNEEFLFGMIFSSTSLFTSGRIITLWYRKFFRKKIN